MNSEYPGQAVDPDILGSVQDDLRVLNADVAKRFHALAASLQASAKQGRAVTELSRQVAGIAGGGESDRAIALLRQVLDDAERFQGLAGTSEDHLRGIVTQLDASRVPLERLQKLPAQLYAIGTLARIEGTRLKNAKVDVSSLATDIDILAEQIERHVTEIATEEHRLHALIMQSAADLNAIATRERQQAADLRAQTGGVIDPLRERAEASRNAVLRIDKQYISIHRATDQIVMSLQSEDIARQRVEHVQQALREAATPSPGQARVLLLQRAQLTGTRDLLANSLSSVLDSLRALIVRVTDLTSETTALASKTGEDGRSFAEAIQHGLKGVSAIFSEYSSSAQMVVSTVESVLTSVSDMSKGANELGRVASSIRRTALNAIIETSHLGGEGAAMRALGGEVQNITDQSKGDTRIVVQGLRTVEEALQAISVCESQAMRTGEGSRHAAAVEDEVRHLCEAIAQSGELIAARFSEVLKTAAGLQAELERACATAEDARAVQAAFDAVLRKLDVQIEALGGVQAAVEANHDTAQLSKLYSMQTEREVHIQVFGDAAGSNSDNAQTTADEELGDGIELF